VGVLDHHENRPVPAQKLEHIPNRRVQAVALGVRVGYRRRGGPRPLLDEVGDEAAQFDGAAPDRGRQAVALDSLGQALERLRERAVGGLYYCVTRSVEHQHTVRYGRGRELPDEPALA